MDMYNQLNNKFKLKENNNLKNLVNFKENLAIPIHRWFNIKEGYSEELVNSIILSLIHSEQDITIVDPFLGSGTTIISANGNGYNGIGVEVNPFLHFLSSVKLETYTDKELDIINEEITILKQKNENSKNFFDKNIISDKPKLSIIDKLFPNNLDEVLMNKGHILKIKNSKVRSFLFLGFLSILEETSTSKKDGNGLKYPKNKSIPPFSKTLNNKLSQMINDIKPHKMKNKIFYGSSISELKESNIPNSNYFTMFSPPYMNCFDYTEIYKLELWMGDFVKDYSDLKVLRDKSLSSHLNKKYQENSLKNTYVDFFVNEVEKNEPWSNKIPLMIDSYFNDMEKVLRNIYNYSMKNNYCVIVVGNSSYANIAIPTDQILADIGLNIGFSSAEVVVARKLGTSSQQYKRVNNVNVLRESLIILKK